MRFTFRLFNVPFDYSKLYNSFWSLDFEPLNVGAGWNEFIRSDNINKINSANLQVFQIILKKNVSKKSSTN